MKGERGSGKDSREILKMGTEGEGKDTWIFNKGETEQVIVEK